MQAYGRPHLTGVLANTLCTRFIYLQYLHLGAHAIICCKLIEIFLKRENKAPIWYGLMLFTQPKSITSALGNRGQGGQTNREYKSDADGNYIGLRGNAILVSTRIATTTNTSRQSKPWVQQHQDH
jgi:hypothetical protein